MKSPSIAKRNAIIRARYQTYLRDYKLQAKFAKNKLAEEFFLSYAQIENIIYRQEKKDGDGQTAKD